MFDKLSAKLLSVSCGILSLVGVAVAQDPQYTQFYANQMLLNPAFSGAALTHRFAMNYRAQWVSIPGSYRQFAFSYDTPLLFGNSLQGIGVVLNTDRAGEGNLQKLEALLSYSYAIHFGSYDNQHVIRFGVQGGFTQSSIDFFRLRFGDQIDPREGFVRATSEIQPNLTYYNPDVNAGVAYYNKYFWLGGAVHHIIEPEQKFTNFAVGDSIDTTLPMRINVHTGLNIPIGPMNDPEKVMLTPALMYRKQRNFTQLDLGMYLTYEPLVIGVWYRTQDAVAGLVGFRQGQLSVGYSYDYTISNLTNRNSGGSHELSLIYELEKNKKTTFKHKKMPCPRF